VNADDFIQKIGKRKLNAMRDEILDFIIDLREQVAIIKRNSKNK
jgi:hypothetical protein